MGQAVVLGRRKLLLELGKPFLSSFKNGHSLAKTPDYCLQVCVHARVANLHRMDVIVIKKLLLLHATLVLQVTS